MPDDIVPDNLLPDNLRSKTSDVVPDHLIPKHLKVSTAASPKAGAASPTAPAVPKKETPSTLKIPGLDIRPPSEYDPSRDPFKTAPGAQMTYGQATRTGAELGVPLAASALTGGLFDAFMPTVPAVSGLARFALGALRGGFSGAAGLAGFKVGQAGVQAAERQPIDILPTASDLGWFVGAGAGIGAATRNMGAFEDLAAEARQEIKTGSPAQIRRLARMQRLKQTMASMGYSPQELRAASNSAQKGTQYRESVKAVTDSYHQGVSRQFDEILGDEKKAPIDVASLNDSVAAIKDNYEPARWFSVSPGIKTQVARASRSEVVSPKIEMIGGDFRETPPSRLLNTVDDLLAYRTDVQNAVRGGNADDHAIKNQLFEVIDGLIDKAAPLADKAALKDARSEWKQVNELEKVLHDPTSVGVGQADALWNLPKGAAKDRALFNTFLDHARLYDAAHPDAPILPIMRETWMVRAQEAMDARTGGAVKGAGPTEDQIKALREQLNDLPNEARGMLFPEGSPLRYDSTWIKMFGRAGTRTAIADAAANMGTLAGRFFIPRFLLAYGIYGAIGGQGSPSSAFFGYGRNASPQDRQKAEFALGTAFVGPFIVSRIASKIIMANGDTALQRAYLSYLTGKPRDPSVIKSFWTGMIGAIQGHQIGAAAGHPQVGTALGIALAMGFHQWRTTEAKEIEPPQGGGTAPAPPTAGPPPGPAPQPAAAQPLINQPVESAPAPLTPPVAQPQPIPPQAPAMQQLSAMRRPPKQERIAPSPLLNKPVESAPPPLTPPPDPTIKEVRPQPNGTIIEMPLSALTLDPDTFQFKSNYDRTGKVRGSIADDIQAWNPHAGGVLSVWHDAEASAGSIQSIPINQSGPRFVIGRGHQRYSASQRLGVKTLPIMAVTSGKDPVIQTPAGPVRATATNMSAKAAASFFARTELMERTSTSSMIDLAKVMRAEGKNPEQLAQEGLAVSTDTARKAIGIANLADPIFHATALGTFDENYAAQIGNAFPLNKAMQEGAFQRIRDLQESGKPLSIGVVQEFINEARFAGSGMVETGGETADMFGKGAVEKSHVYERALLASKLKQELRVVKSATRSATSHADVLAEANTVVDVETGQHITLESKQALEKYDTLVRTGQGEISAAMKKASADLAQAKDKSAQTKIMREAMPVLRQALRNDLQKLGSPPPPDQS